MITSITTRKITHKITCGTTDNQQTNNKQITTNKNNKNEKNNKNIKNINKDIDIDNKKIKAKTEKEGSQFAEFVSMTMDEYDKLVNTYGKEFTDQCITVLDNYKGATGKKYKSDYRAILNWVVDRVKQDKKKQDINQKSNNPFLDILREEGKI